MCKPGKSFNTWVKVYFSSHESVTRVCPMNHGHWFGQPPVGGVQIGLFKTMRQRAALSSCAPELSGFSLQRAQGWPGSRSAGRSPWNQPSEEVQDRAKASTAASTAVIPTRLPGDVTQQRREPAEVPRATRRNPRAKRDKGPACLNQQKQVSSISISDWTGKFDLNAVTKPRHLSWSFLVGSSYEIGKNAILSTFQPKLRYACVYVCVYYVC